MPKIYKLDKATIDMIAAGEVVERPSSVVKELVENAIDSGASAITVEIRDGGTSLIRVTDNGCGISPDQVRIAFAPHATSKISTIDDIFSLNTLGFRGEALASIAAVSKFEMTTRTKDNLTGIHYLIHGGKEVSFDEIGTPEGTTCVVKDLFYNTPARRKFLKSPKTEASYIADLMERFSIGFPDISFHFIRDKKDDLATSGKGDYKELIYRIYGKDVSGNIIPVFAEKGGVSITGYLGKPILNRANRNSEIFFVNGRYIKDKMLSKALEDGYQGYLMQHKFPFSILMLEVPADTIDVNVHPSKMEIRFHDNEFISDFIIDTIHNKLFSNEMIPDALYESDKSDHRVEGMKNVPEPFENEKRLRQGFGYELKSAARELNSEGLNYGKEDIKEDKSDVWFDGEAKESTAYDYMNGAHELKETAVNEVPYPENGISEKIYDTERVRGTAPTHIIKRDRQVIVEKAEQLNMFDVRMLTDENRPEYKILGQVFDTYWIIVFRDKMYMVDQHAAHEKVNYERMMKRFHESDTLSQLLEPPVMIDMTAREEDIYTSCKEGFEALGFQLDHFGQSSYAMRAVPYEMYGYSEKEMFMEILDELCEEGAALGRKINDPAFITSHIATKACKASVKGNSRMSTREMEVLIDELLTLDNPYNCPHGRPTIISMSKYDIDRRFKRIVN